jgi:hypothetical protein
MEPVTRRSFLVKSGVGAAGAATALSVGWKLTSDDASQDALSSDEIEQLDGPVMVHIKDAKAGEVEVLVGERSVQFTDKGLVAKLLRASR